MSQTQNEVAPLVAGLIDKDATAADIILGRLKEAFNAKSDTALAKILGLKQSAMSSAKSRGQIPPAWLITAASISGISIDWLVTGEGNMFRSEANFTSYLPQNQGNGTIQPNPTSQSEAVNRYKRLEEDICREREERRQLAEEHRQISAENRQLLKENGDLRVEVAELKAELKSRGEADAPYEADRRSA